MQDPKVHKRIVLLIVGVSLMIISLQADDQSWMNNSLSFTIDSQWILKFTNEMRFFDITGLIPYKKNIQGGLVYKFPRNIYAALMYKRELEDKGGLPINENRFTLESGWKTLVRSILELDLRFRTEVRHFENGLATNHLRFRLRVRLKTQVNIGKLRFNPFIATEPFADNKVDRIFRNRFYLGTLFPLGDNVELVANYIRQDTRGEETNHILNTGFDLTF